MTLLAQRVNKKNMNFPLLESQYNHHNHKINLVKAIQETIANENRFIKLALNMDDAEKLLQAKNGQELLSRIVHHFKELFDVQKIEGILPKMNQLYMFTSEANSAMKTLQECLERSGIIVPAPQTISQVVLRTKQLIELRK